MSDSSQADTKPPEVQAKIKAAPLIKGWGSANMEAERMIWLRAPSTGEISSAPARPAQSLDAHRFAAKYQGSMHWHCSDLTSDQCSSENSMLIV